MPNVRSRRRFNPLRLFVQRLAKPFQKRNNDPSDSGGSDMDWQGIAAAVDIVLRETMLFASIGLLVGGIDDFAVDLLFVAIRLTGGARRSLPRFVTDIPLPSIPRRLIVFVPAWDESPVIGAMLHAALARFEHPDFALYVGAYPNDRATIDAIAGVATSDPRVRLVINERDGPTTKGDCLNTLWHALLRDEAAGDRPAAAVILHDAEDVVHPDELTVFDHLLDRYSTIQLPVLPLVDRGSRWVSGHYCDEFAEPSWALA